MPPAINERAFQNVVEAYGVLAEHLEIFDIAEVLGFENSWQLHTLLISLSSEEAFGKSSQGKDFGKAHIKDDLTLKELKYHAVPEVGNALSQIAIMTQNLKLMKMYAELKAGVPVDLKVIARLEKEIEAELDWDAYDADHNDMESEIDVALQREEQSDTMWGERKTRQRETIQVKNIKWREFQQAQFPVIDFEAVFPEMPNRQVNVDVEFRFHHKGIYDVDNTKTTFGVVTDDSSSTKVEGISVYFRNYNQPFEVRLTANDVNTGEKICTIISSNEISGWHEVIPVRSNGNKNGNGKRSEAIPDEVEA